MVVNALAYHPVVSHWLKFTATTAGRDKILRTIQYIARFIAWYNIRTNRTADAIAPFEAIKKNFSVTRKALRLGKFVEHFRAAAHAADAKVMDPVLRYCAIGRQLGYGVYLLLDNYTMIDTIGARKLKNAARIQRESTKAWMVGLAFNIVAGLYTLTQLRKREALVNKKEGEGVIEGKNIQRERKVTQTQLLSDVCDVVIPLSSLGLVQFDEGFVGLAGTVSSLIGLSTVWKKTA